MQWWYSVSYSYMQKVASVIKRTDLGTEESEVMWDLRIGINHMMVLRLELSYVNIYFKYYETNRPGNRRECGRYHIVTMVVFSFELSNVKKRQTWNLKKVWQGIMFCMFSQSMVKMLCIMQWWTFRNRIKVCRFLNGK